MKNNTIWSKIVGSYLLANGLYAMALFVYLLYINSPYLSQGPKFIFFLNNLAFPCISALVGYFLLLKPNEILFVRIYLIASIFGIGYGKIIYWSGHGWVLSTFFAYSGFFFAINFTALIGLVLIYKHSMEISNLNNSNTESGNISSENN